MASSNFTNLSAWENIKEIHRISTITSAKGILFVMCCLFAGVAIHFGSRKYHYPYTVGCFLFGVIIGYMEINSPLIQNFTLMTRMNPSDMLLTFLPILIFESSFGMDAHMFFRALPQCLILAVLGFLFCTILTAVFAMYVLASYGWSWLTALIFGSIVSATDPVAVVALLKEMKMPHTFTVLIEGESLLNDGVAIVMYELIAEMIELQEAFEFKTTIVKLLTTCIGAPVFGYIIGKISEWILIRIYISPVSEMTIIIVMAYVSYFVAERFLGISAVLAVVLYGVTLNSNRMCISPESAGLIHTDWRLLAIYANTLIFMIVGILVTVSFSQFYNKMDAWLILLTYIFLTLLRSLMVFILYPLLKRTGYGLNWKEGIVLSWGGLRGAIGLALSLTLASNPHIPDSVNTKKVLVQVSGIIVLTLIVNANTVKYIMKLIKFKELTLVNRLSMGNVIACVTEVKEKSLRICKRDWKLMKADWKWVMSKISLNDPYEGGLYGDDPNMSSLFIPYGTCDECLTTQLPYAPSENELNELKEAARRKVLRAVKGHLWKQFRNGLLQRRSLKLLCTAVDHSSDTPSSYLKTEDVRKFMKVRKLHHWLETKLSYLIQYLKLKSTFYSDEEIHCQKSKNETVRNCCIWLYFSWWFNLIIFGVIVLNIIHIVIDIYFIVHPEISKYEEFMIDFGAFFIIFYILEFTIKIYALKWRHFIKSDWNKMDFILSLIAVIEGIIDLILFRFPSLHTFGTHIRILIALRLIRYSYIIVNAFACILSVIRNCASSELYYAYDTGRGFLFASEAVLKNIDMIVDFGPCAKIPISVCEKNIKEMLDVLDEFEKKYPAVALAVKSNRSARKILNRVKSVLDHLTKKALILPEDAREMKLILFKKTKMVVNAPRNRPVIENIRKVLQEVDWVTPKIAVDLYENHTIVTYEAGEVIQEVGQNHQFVYIIARGIIKVVGEKLSQESHLAYNKLPNADSFLFFHKDSKLQEVNFHDYLTTSQTIGLLGFLQKTPSVTTAICEKDCELIQIDYLYLDDALENYEDLLYCMWKSIAIKVSFHLLKKERRYMGLSAEDIYLRLQKGILPDLVGMAHWNVPALVDAMIIIQGRIKDATTEIEFTAPSYIPSTSRILQILDDSKKRPPVILLLLLDQKYDLCTFQNWIKPDMDSGMLNLGEKSKRYTF